MLSLEQSIVQEVHFSPFSESRNRLFIKRDDLIHSEVSGNKWRKLKYNIELARESKLDGVLTFGGAFSNHLVATAAACQMAGLRSVGVVRGDELNSQSNETLKRCSAYGMDLVFISRSDYAERHERLFQENLKSSFPNFHLVPEGGANYYGMIGCQELMNETSNDFDIVALAQGTTTTSCGILMGLPEQTSLWVFPVLKGFESSREMSELLKRAAFESDWLTELFQQVEVYPDFHFGGYAQVTEELLDFIELFYKDTAIPLDPGYTAKAMYGLINRVEGLGIKDKRILFIHTGGLQGAKAIFEKQKRKIY
jgi:1-aminocyclopropane-1-carboxylate deaminase